MPFISLTLLLCAMPTENAAADVLRYFEQVTQSGLAEYLVKKRPSPITEEEKSIVLAALPLEGELTLNSGQRKKLSAIQPVLAFYRRDTVVTIKVVRLPYGCIALHARSVLIIGESALNLLPAAELKAIASHELAHEYFWSEYVSARRRNDKRQLRKLELLADGIGMAALAELGLPATELTVALRHLNAFNAQFGPPANSEDYPSRNEREGFHLAFNRVFILDRCESYKGER